MGIEKNTHFENLVHLMVWYQNFLRETFYYIYLHVFLKERQKREIHIVSLKQAYEEWKIGTGYVSIGKQVPAWSLRGSSKTSSRDLNKYNKRRRGIDLSSW